MLTLFPFFFSPLSAYSVDSITANSFITVPRIQKYPRYGSIAPDEQPALEQQTPVPSRHKNNTSPIFHQAFPDFFSIRKAHLRVQITIPLHRPQKTQPIENQPHIRL